MDSSCAQDGFNYLVVLIGVILGLGVVQILTGLASMIRNRKTIRIYWVHLVWCATIFLLLIQHWYVIYTWRDFGSTFASYVYFMIYPTLLYAGSALLAPKVENAQKVDFEEIFYADRHWFFGICFLGLTEIVFRSLLFNNTSIVDTQNLIRLAGLFIVVMLGWTHRKGVHAIGATVSLGLLVIFIALYSSTFHAK